MSLLDSTKGFCILYPKNYNRDADQLFDLLEEAGFEISENNGTIFGSDFDKDYQESEILSLFSRIENMLKSAEFKFSNFIIGEGEENWYFKYDRKQWYSGSEKTIIDYKKLDLPEKEKIMEEEEERE